MFHLPKVWKQLALFRIFQLCDGAIASKLRWMIHLWFPLRIMFDDLNCHQTWPPPLIKKENLTKISIKKFGKILKRANCFQTLGAKRGSQLYYFPKLWKQLVHYRIFFIYNFCILLSNVLFSVAVAAMFDQKNCVKCQLLANFGFCLSPNSQLFAISFSISGVIKKCNLQDHFVILKN
jgi:hypothetical protein